jgi:L-fuculokinase
VIAVIAILDVGKTNKKLLLFDTHYKLVFEKTDCLEETKDEDGFPCEDVRALTLWVENTLAEITTSTEFEIKAINFSAYGASLVHLNKHGEVITALYNYIKPFPAGLQEKFYEENGGRDEFSRITASPVLGNLNSGMQLYRLKKEQPEVFSKIATSVHLPQYISYLVTGKAYAEITSIGCHTNLWNFERQEYHPWVRREGLGEKFPPISRGSDVVAPEENFNPMEAGIGLHDSSSALIPYLIAFREPFILLSTGTWCISLNPFDHSPLTREELTQDCLCYLSYTGNPVKASRIFAGHDHEEQAKRLAAHFNVPANHYSSVRYSPGIQVKWENIVQKKIQTPPTSFFQERDLSVFRSYEGAYHQLMADIVVQQVASTQLVLGSESIRRIFVDGGFSQNSIYMNLMAIAFPGIEVYAAKVPQASALGAALAIHHHWNPDPIPVDLIELKLYSNPR